MPVSGSMPDKTGAESKSTINPDGSVLQPEVGVDFDRFAEAQLWESLRVPLIIINADGQVVRWNPAAEAATGWAPEQICGQYPDDVSDPLCADFLRTVAHLDPQSAGVLWPADETVSQPRYRLSAAEVTGSHDQVYRLVTLHDMTTREEHLESELSKGNAFIEKVLDNLPIGLAINTLDSGNIGYANARFLEIYGGWSKGDFTDLETFFTLVIPNAREREEVRQRILQDLASGDRARMKWDSMRITCRDGSEKIVSVRNIPIPDMNLMISTVQDVTEQKHVEQALRESERRYQVMAESSPTGIFRLHLDGTVCHVNKAWREISGLTASQVLGQGWGMVIHPDDQALVLEAWRNAQQEMRTFKTECRFKRPGGRTAWVLCQIEPIADTQGMLEGFIGSITDISRRKRTEEEIRQLAYYDTLTGLPNRTFFMEQLDRALSTAGRNDRHVALLFCDLDNFKDVNDTLGHDKGDLLLSKIAHRLNACIRRGDTLCRLGGDEFVLLLPSMRKDREMAAVSRKIQGAMAKPFDLDGYEIHATMSIGIAVFPEDGRDVHTLLKHADMAMYAAKGKGRNQFQFFSREMNRRAQERLGMEAGLRQALRRDELFLVWQPQYDLASEKLIGVEALLRWNHPDLGVIQPMHFIPLAEETGLIHQIGEMVLQTAGRQARQWAEQGAADLRVAVNLSGIQFTEPELVDTLQGILKDTGMDPAMLELEITESVLVKDARLAGRVLKSLHEDGIKLAIDDFGTGYSSLLYLKNFPVGRIKIAQEFVRDIADDPQAAAIAGTVIDMARNLSMRSIAEGVETEGQARVLRELNCHEVQGFLFAKPMSAEDFGQILSSS